MSHSDDTQDALDEQDAGTITESDGAYAERYAILRGILVEKTDLDAESIDEFVEYQMQGGDDR